MKRYENIFDDWQEEDGNFTEARIRWYVQDDGTITIDRIVLLKEDPVEIEGSPACEGGLIDYQELLDASVPGNEV